MKIRSFTKLIVWQKAHQLVIEIYKISENFPKTECFGLTQQIRRAAVSISSNIAEGFSKFYKKDKIKFYNISWLKF
jgi:four helix bundle protein